MHEITIVCILLYVSLHATQGTVSLDTEHLINSSAFISIQYSPKISYLLCLVKWKKIFDIEFFFNEVVNFYSSLIYNTYTLIIYQIFSLVELLCEKEYLI